MSGEGTGIPLTDLFAHPLLASASHFNLTGGGGP